MHKLLIIRTGEERVTKFALFSNIQFCWVIEWSYHDETNFI